MALPHILPIIRKCTLSINGNGKSICLFHALGFISRFRMVECGHGGNIEWSRRADLGVAKYMNSQVQLEREFLAEFCRKWRIRELSIFGSALRSDFGPDSDLDFLVSFQPETPLDLFDLLDMKEELEIRFSRPVDLVEKEALRNPWRKYEIMRTREVIYAA